MSTERKRITAHEAARRLGKKPNTLAGWRLQKRGPSWHHIGRSVYYWEDEIRDWRPEPVKRNPDLGVGDICALYTTGAYTIYDLADMAGVSHTTISRWLNGQVSRTKPGKADRATTVHHERLVQAALDDLKSAEEALQAARDRRDTAMYEAYRAGVPSKVLARWARLTRAGVRAAIRRLR